jgi:hypothetical protein
MGAKTWMLVSGPADLKQQLAKYPALDRTAALSAASRLFPKTKLEPLQDGSLTWTCPPDDEIHVGVFGDVTIVAAKEFGIDRPSELPKAFVEGSELAVLHAMHSVVDWFALAKWSNGVLDRSLSVSPDDGIIEDIGTRADFETPYWKGEHSAVDPEDEDDEMPCSLPFHPLELGEEALRTFFGYQLEGSITPDLLETGRFTLLRFKRKKSIFAFWR